MVANTSLFCGVLRYLKRSSPVTSRLSVFLLVNYYGSLIDREIDRESIKYPKHTPGYRGVCINYSRGFVRGCVIKSTSVDFPDQHLEI